MTADYEWGPGESHYESHRYMVSVYSRQHSDLPDNLYYYLEDRYLTARKYDLEEKKDDVLTSEKPEILRRLYRIKAVRTARPNP